MSQQPAASSQPNPASVAAPFDQAHGKIHEVAQRVMSAERDISGLQKKVDKLELDSAAVKGHLVAGGRREDLPRASALTCPSAEVHGNDSVPVYPECQPAALAAT